MRLQLSYTLLFVRHFKTTCTVCKEYLRNSKNKSYSSQQWLRRQLSDPYVEKAKLANYRCRSAFKLIEIDEKYHILRPGKVVIDCGAAPGSWTQVAVARTNADKKRDNMKVGTVIGIDLKPVHIIEGATLLSNLDFTQQETKDKILEVLKDKGILKSNNDQGCVDVVLNDMSPNTTGVKFMDHTNIIALCYAVIRFALPLTVKNGCLLMKVFDGEDTKKLVNDLNRFYTSVKYIKPNSSRSDSAEMFLLATGFKGIRR